MRHENSLSRLGFLCFKIMLVLGMACVQTSHAQNGKLKLYEPSPPVFSPPFKEERHWYDKRNYMDKHFGITPPPLYTPPGKSNKFYDSYDKKLSDILNAPPAKNVVRPLVQDKQLGLEKREPPAPVIIPPTKNKLFDDKQLGLKKVEPPPAPLILPPSKNKLFDDKQLGLKLVEPPKIADPEPRLKPFVDAKQEFFANEPKREFKAAEEREVADPPGPLARLLPGLNTIENAFCALGNLGRTLLRSFSGVTIGGAVAVPHPALRNLVQGGCDLAIYKKGKVGDRYKLGTSVGCFPELKAGKVHKAEADIDFLFNCDPPTKLAGFGTHVNVGGYGFKAQLGEKVFEDIASVVTGRSMPTPETFRGLSEKLNVATKTMSQTLKRLEADANVNNLILSTFQAPVESSANGKRPQVGRLLADMIALHKSKLKRLESATIKIDELRNQLGHANKDVNGVVRAALAAKLAEAQSDLDEITSVLAEPIAQHFVTVGDDGFQVKNELLRTIDDPLVLTDEYFKATKGKLFRDPAKNLLQPFDPPRQKTGLIIDRNNQVVGEVLANRFTGQGDSSKLWLKEGKWKQLVGDINSPKLKNGKLPSITIDDELDLLVTGSTKKMGLSGTLGTGVEFLLPPNAKKLGPLTVIPSSDLEAVKDHLRSVAKTSVDVYHAMKGISLLTGEDTRRVKAGGGLDLNRSIWGGPKSAYFNGCFSFSIPLSHIVEGGGKGLMAAFATAIPILANLGGIIGDFSHLPRAGREFGREVAKLIHGPLSAAAHQVDHGVRNNFKFDSSEMYGSIYHVYKDPTGLTTTQFKAPDLLNDLFLKVERNEECGGKNGPQNNPPAPDAIVEKKQHK